jgi:hypothetical protein
MVGGGGDKAKRIFLLQWANFSRPLNLIGKYCPVRMPALYLSFFLVVRYYKRIFMLCCAYLKYSQQK